jgi:hypothetical protein
MIERANENRRRAKKKTETKPTVVKEKGKRGRKPKVISVPADEILFENQPQPQPI